MKSGARYAKRGQTRFKPEYGSVDLTWSGSLTRTGSAIDGFLQDRHGWRFKLSGSFGAPGHLVLAAAVTRRGAIFAPWTDAELRDALDQAGSSARLDGALRLEARAWTGEISGARCRIVLQGETTTPGHIALRGQG